MVLACQGQLRLAPSGHIIGIDMDAALKIGAARGPDLAVLSELLPAAEAGLLKGRSGGASTKHLYRSGTSSTDDHILWLASGVTPNLRHDSNTGTVTITSSVSHQRHRVAHARGHVAPAAAGAVPGRHLAGQQHRGEH